MIQTDNQIVHHTFDAQRVRSEFPILERQVNNKPLVYADNAATTQKPRVVIEAIADYYSSTNSNVHRGAHFLSAEATLLYENARERVQKFLNASELEEIVFTKGTTESINLVAESWGRLNLAAGDEVIVSEMEHHANIVPWQMICEKVGASVVEWKLEDNATLSVETLQTLITNKTKLIAVNHASNTLGVINPVKEICALASQQGVATLVDGAQMVLHGNVDVQDIGCDFYAFSGHKLYGPTGIGVLYGKREILETMPPYQGGGAMISNVSFEKTTYNSVPTRFEAGTPNIAGAAGLLAAISWFSELDLTALDAHEKELTDLATEGLQNIAGVKILGPTQNKIAVISFVVDGCHSADIGVLCDQQGVALRTGHHCTMPLLERFGITSAVRASFAAYNTQRDVVELVSAVERSVRMLR